MNAGGWPFHNVRRAANKDTWIGDGWGGGGSGGEDAPLSLLLLLEEDAIMSQQLFVKGCDCEDGLWLLLLLDDILDQDHLRLEQFGHFVVLSKLEGGEAEFLNTRMFASPSAVLGFNQFLHKLIQYFYRLRHYHNTLSEVGQVEYRFF